MQIEQGNTTTRPMNKREKYMTYTIVGGIALGVVLAIFTVFSTPTEVKATRARLQEIDHRTTQIVTMLEQKKADWELHNTEQQRLQKLADDQLEKKIFVEGQAKELRRELEELMQERLDITVGEGFLLGQ